MKRLATRGILLWILLASASAPGIGRAAAPRAADNTLFVLGVHEKSGDILTVLRGHTGAVSDVSWRLDSGACGRPRG